MCSTVPSRPIYRIERLVKFHRLENRKCARHHPAEGAKPAETPIQTPTKFEFILNLQTANSLGLNIPASIQLRADEVIE